MISSAVVVPEASQEQGRTPLQSPTLKRKLSPPPENDSKRPRIDTTTLSNVSQANSAEPQSTASHSKGTSPSHRRSSALGTDEKKRNQRLFGSLLGTLSQTTTKPAHRKRDEIEARQCDRLKRQREEQEEERRRKKEQVEVKRRRHQELWDEEGMRLRHGNMRAMAGFLQTKTEPRLYYKPWELRGEEEERIRRQKEDVERQIGEELGQDRPTSRNGEDLQCDEQTDAEPELTKGTEARRKGTERQDDESPQQPEPRTASDEPQPSLMLDKQDDRHKDDDHQGEELVEGQEDDVIY